MKKISHGCTLDCADCCKFDVYVEGNKIIKIQGDKNHPYTKGFICKKGLAHLDRLNHENRIYTPLLKVNGEWEEISFNKALDIMAEKLIYYKEKYTSKSILYYEQYGNGALLKSIGEVFCNFYGGVTKTKGGPCWSAGIGAQKLDFGDSRSHSLEDMINSKSIFVWGKNPANTTIHTMQMIKKAKANGSKIIVIDPIYTATAKIADKYVRVNPGGDGALALAMGKIIIEEKLYDEEYINSYVLGFDEYKKYVTSLNLEQLSTKCGVAVKEIFELVKLYTDKYTTILLGYGMQKYKNGGNTIRAVDALGAITGQIGYSGGGVNYANKVYPDVLNSDPYNSMNVAEERLCYVSEISQFITSANCGTTYYKDGLYIKDTSDNEKLHEMNIPIKMAIITKSNLLNQLADLNSLKKSFSEIEFKVCFDMFLTDTAEESDLFIPTTSTLESEDLLYSSMMNPYIIYNEKVIEPKEKLMDEYYFFGELAKRIKLNNYPHVSKKEYLTKVIEPLREFYKDINLDLIKESYITLHKPIAWEDKKFLTPSGKFEISIYEENFNSSNGDGFRLLTNHGKDSLASQHLMDEEGKSKAYINEKMAKKINVIDKSLVILKSNNGTVEVELNIDNSVGDNIVMMYAGWWRKHGNPNYITDSGLSDIGGQVTYNETFVEIINIGR
jgi:anaerobic selenocysteine-containing dehydrogenase